MFFKHCQNVDRYSIYDIDEESNECEICHKTTARTLTAKGKEGAETYAHSYCIMNQNKKLIYQMDIR